MARKKNSKKSRKRFIDLSRREAITILGLVVSVACSTQVLVALGQVAQASGNLTGETSANKASRPDSSQESSLQFWFGE